MTSLDKNQNIPILPVDKARCTAVLNTVDYYADFITLIDHTKAYETLRQDPTSKYKQKKKKSSY